MVSEYQLLDKYFSNGGRVWSPRYVARYRGLGLGLVLGSRFGVGLGLVLGLGLDYGVTVGLYYHSGVFV